MDVESELAKWDSDWSLRTNDVSGWRHVLTIADRCGLDTKPWRTATAAAEFGALPDEPTAPAQVATSIIKDHGSDELTEEHMSRAFALAHVNKLAFDHTAGRWYVFNGGVWRLDERQRATWLVREYCAAQRMAFGGNDKASTRRMFSRSVEALAQSDLRIALSADAWDRDRWLLGVPGGYVDLRTGETHPGDPTKYITLSCAVAPEQGDAPTWLGFLNFATGGDLEYVAWLQRFVGYCLTGDVTEEILAFFYGEEGTGKGTFLRTLRGIVESYAYQAPADTFIANGRTNPEYQRAKMAGRRVVMAAETESGASLAGSFIKELTGNEGKINARLPYGQPFEFDAQAKLILVSNHEPKLRGSPEGLTRQLCVVPFDRKPDIPNKRLKDMLVPEYPRILAWMIEGCLAWQKHGLGQCEPVRAASAKYFESQDAFGAWATERVERCPALQTKRTELYADYAVWSKAAGESVLSAGEFYELMKRALACETKMIRGVRLLSGVALRSPDRAEFGSTRVRRSSGQRPYAARELGHRDDCGAGGSR